MSPNFVSQNRSWVEGGGIVRAKNNGRSTINDRTKIDNDRPTSDPTDHFDRSNFYRHIVGSNTV
jgi:hypothetical protein